MDKTIVARAQQIAESAPERRMLITEAAAAAIIERFDGDAKRIAAFAAEVAQSKFKDIRKNTYELPDEPTLFDVPSDIVITTPEGDLFILGDEATPPQIRQWITEGAQFHGSQHKKFKRLGVQFDAVEDQLTPDLPAKPQLKSLEAADQ